MRKKRSEWNGPAFSPTANMLFVNSVDVCFSVKLTPETLKGASGSPYTGGTGPTEAFGKFDPKENWKGWVTALNADDGTVKWKFQSPTPMLAAITATGGGLEQDERKRTAADIMRKHSAHRVTYFGTLLIEEV